PAADGPWEYYTRYRTGEQHPLFCRRPRGRTAGEMVLLDANELAQGKAYSGGSARDHSPDHALFAYAEAARGSAGPARSVQVLPDPTQSATGNFTFSPDSQWIFWTNRDDNGRPDKIFRRPARGGETTLVYEEDDDGMFISVGRSSDDRFMLISIENQETSEV